MYTVQTDRGGKGVRKSVYTVHVWHDSAMHASVSRTIARALQLPLVVCMSSECSEGLILLLHSRGSEEAWRAACAYRVRL